MGYFLVLFTSFHIYPYSLTKTTIEENARFAFDFPFQAPFGAQERGGSEAVPSGEPAARLPLRTGLEGHLQGRVEDHVEEVVDAVIGHDVEVGLTDILTKDDKSSFGLNAQNNLPEIPTGASP